MGMQAKSPDRKLAVSARPLPSTPAERDGADEFRGREILDDAALYNCLVETTSELSSRAFPYKALDSRTRGERQ